MGIKTKMKVEKQLGVVCNVVINVNIKKFIRREKTKADMKRK